MSAPTGRALTPAEKRAVIERIHAAWIAVPHQRLGQLIANACGGDAFYTENTTLAELCEAFAKERPR